MLDVEGAQTWKVAALERISIEYWGGFLLGLRLTAQRA